MLTKPKNKNEFSITDESRAAQAALEGAVKKAQDVVKATAPSAIGALSPGAQADLRYQLEQAKSVVKSITATLEDLLDEAAKQMDENFVNTLGADDSTGVQGKLSRIQISTKAMPTVDNWTMFYAYIQEHGAFELLNKAVNIRGVSERWENGETLPGVGQFTKKKVSVTKLTGKAAG